ncbi:MAG: hypothetical protein COV48_15495 [Elusimicrobia bacterium CG11_big_fil_rev_8_21_14_0_20_64_6]|nr:MAG: hypothetical protein COV48_15495 [Elusimicrobia bacterium CG11_big_fil_rev_8_21_14_0_20_64_6]
MRTSIKTALLAAMTMLAALPAAAELSTPAIAHDPLMNQIMSKQLTLPGGGVTGVVRIGSGQAIALRLIDPLAPLQPAAGLVAKSTSAVKAKDARKARRADEQLKKMSEEKRRADWSGRK